jgi:hypothetical protein
LSTTAPESGSSAPDGCAEPLGQPAEQLRLILADPGHVAPLAERLARIADELRLELLRASSNDPRDLGLAEVLAQLEMRLHDLYE